jgi:hypothetical protein
VLPFIKDHFTADHRHHHAHLAESLGRYLTEILSEDDEVGRLTDLKTRGYLDLSFPGL